MPRLFATYLKRPGVVPNMTATTLLVDDPYKVLGLEHLCSDEEIKTAFRRAVKENHPDVGGTNEDMVALNFANDQLKTPAIRAVTDFKLRESHDKDQASSSPGPFTDSPGATSAGTTPAWSSPVSSKISRSFEKLAKYALVALVAMFVSATAFAAGIFSTLGVGLGPIEFSSVSWFFVSVGAFIVFTEMRFAFPKFGHVPAALMVLVILLSPFLLSTLLLLVPVAALLTLSILLVAFKDSKLS